MFVAQRYIGPEGSGMNENEFFNQRGPKKFTRKNWRELSIQDRKKMQVRIDDARNKMMESFPSFPPQLFLVLR